MKIKTFAMTTLLTSLLVAPLVHAAEGEACSRHGDKRMEHHRMMKTHDTHYSAAELQVLAQAKALRHVGPGAQAVVEAAEEGTYKVSVRDAQGNLLREVVINHFGQPLRADREDDATGPTGAVGE